MKIPKNKTTRPLNLRYVTARQGKKKFWVAGILKYFKGQKFFLTMYRQNRTQIKKSKIKVGLGRVQRLTRFPSLLLFWRLGAAVQNKTLLFHSQNAVHRVL